MSFVTAPKKEKKRDRSVPAQVKGNLVSFLGDKPVKEGECQIKYKPIGCFHDDMEIPRPLPELILNERDPTHPSWNKHLVDWKRWDTYMLEFICRCAAKTKEKGFRFFSTQFFGKTLMHSRLLSK